MKRVYIDTENHRVFKSIDELKQDVWFLTDFLCDYRFYLDADKNNKSKKLSEIITDENIEDFLGFTNTDWVTLITNKNTVYLNWGMGIFTDDLKYFVDQLDCDEILNEITRNYDNFLDLFDKIKNTKENGYEFILHNYIEYAEDYDIVNLEE